MNFIPFFEGVLWSISPHGLPLSMNFCLFMTACIINKKCTLSLFVSLLFILLLLPINSLITLTACERGLLTAIFAFFCNLIFLKKEPPLFVATVLSALTFVIGFVPNGIFAFQKIPEYYFYSFGICVPLVLWLLILYFISKDFNCVKIKKPSIYCSFGSSLLLPLYLLEFF